MTEEKLKWKYVRHGAYKTLEALNCMLSPGLGHTQSIQSETQVEHFLRFITRDLVSQDTAYGPSRIKLESGEELFVPKPKRKMIPARVVMSPST